MAIVFFFQTSEHMEAAYGLSITVTMLMTTLLLFEYLGKKKRPF
ncbi:KUP/HAK/KT family potassium transporter, partial [Lactobacillus acetotolerans]